MRVSAASLAWVANAYLISFGGLLLAGRLGDLLGHRICFLIGLGVFTGASLTCGLASSESALVAGRFIQGAGGGMTAAVALGMVVSIFPDPHDRPRAIGVFAFVTSAGGAIGLLAGGILTQFLDWHWIFLVNPPVGLLTAALTFRVVPVTWASGCSAVSTCSAASSSPRRSCWASTQSSAPQPDSAGARRVL